MGCVHGGQHKRPAKFALVRAFRRGRILFGKSLMATVLGNVSPITSEYSEVARRSLDASQCALIVVDIQEKLLPPILHNEQLLKNSQLLIRLANGIRNCLPTAGRAGCRQTSILLLRQRCLLLHAETAAWQSQHSSALWDGEPHLRDANRSGRLARWLSGACGIRRGRFANGVELEDRPRTDA